MSGSKTKEPVVQRAPLTADEHAAEALRLLDVSERAGTWDAANLRAAQANAHATLAVYLRLNG